MGHRLTTPDGAAGDGGAPADDGAAGDGGAPADDGAAGDDGAPADDGAAADDGAPADDGVALEPIEIDVGEQAGSITWLSYWAALDQGCFDDQAIEISRTPFQAGGGTIAAAPASSEIDVMLNTVFFMADSRVQGVPVRILAGQTQRPDIQVIVPPDSPVLVTGEDGNTWEDTFRSLEGLDIGVTGVGGSIFSIVLTLLERVGIDANPEGGDVTWLTMQTGAPQLAALELGQVDAVIAVIATTRTAEQQGIGKLAVDLAIDGPEDLRNLRWTVWGVRDGLVEEHPDVGDRFAAALECGVEFMSDPANVDRLVELAIENQVPPADDLGDLLGEISDNYDPSVTATEIEESLQFAVDSGLIAPDSVPEIPDLVVPTMTN